MTLSKEIVDVSLDPGAQEGVWAEGMVRVLEKVLAQEKEHVHPTLAAILTHLREAPLSPTSRIYALLLGACFVAHMEIAMETSLDGMSTLLARAYQDLQAAIRSGEIPDNIS